MLELLNFGNSSPLSEEEEGATQTFDDETWEDTSASVDEDHYANDLESFESLRTQEADNESANDIANGNGSEELDAHFNDNSNASTTTSTTTSSSSSL